MYKIAIADDNKMMRAALSLFCQEVGLNVILLACNGQQLKDFLFSSVANTTPLPDIILMDISMPGINGIIAAAFVSEHYPSIKIIALSLYTQEKPLIDMLRNGAKGYLSKIEIEPEDLLIAAEAVMKNEMYFSQSILKKWQIPLDYLNTGYHKKYRTSLLSEREYDFLSYCGTDLNYKEIADKMGVNVHTINNYSAAVFERLDIHSRSGLTAYAIVHGLTEIYHPEN